MRPAKRRRCCGNDDQEKLRAALARDGGYLLLSDRTDWTAEDLWSTYTQLTRAEDALRSMKSNLLLRPMWHQKSDRVKAHVFVCVLAYALLKALAHILGNAKLMTRIRKKDPEAPDSRPQDRRMSPEVALKLLHDVQIGNILLETVESRQLRLRRVAYPNAEQAVIITSLGLNLPERICAVRDVTPTDLPVSPEPVATGVPE